MSAESHRFRFPGILRATGIFGIAALLSLTGCAGTPDVTGPDLPEAWADELTWPEAPVAAAISTAEGSTVLSVNDDFPRPLASTAKLITALIVLEEHPLAPGDEGPAVEVVPEYVAEAARIESVGGATLAATLGRTLSQRSLLAGALLVSANNYAYMLAHWGFGSEAAFLERANAWLAENGLHDTILVDSSGLNPDTVGTAADLVRIGQLALREPVIADLVAAKSLTVGPATLENSNLLLSDSSFIGLKTGYLDPVGFNLAFARLDPDAPDGAIVVGAVLGEQSAGFARQDAKRLSEEVFALRAAEAATGGSNSADGSE